MSKVQAEKIAKANIKDKKINRLFHNKAVSEQDELILNYIYEEKQSINTYYGFLFSGMATLLANSMLFRQNTRIMQSIFCGGMFIVMNLGIRQMEERRFYRLINPYLVKYQIK
ncbi:hypothetical protein ABPG73_000910 [Tetrahymena malaccensis]